MEHSENNEIRSIRILLNTAFILQMVYFAINLLVSIMPKAFLTYTNSNALNFEHTMDWPNVISLVLTTGIFAVLYVIFSHKIKTGSESTGGFGVLLGAGLFFAFYIIPRVMGIVGNFVMLKKVTSKEITNETYAAIISLRSILSFFGVLSTAAVVLLCCAYSMYWFRVKYCLYKK